MLPQITRHLIYPLHERLLRRRTFSYVAELEESQWYSPDELRELQSVKLRALLEHAQQNTEFYRHRFRKAGISLNEAAPEEALQRIPLLDKQSIRDAGQRILWKNCPGGLHQCHTGGSSGNPLTFFLDRRRQGYDQAARIRTHRWFNVDVGDRELYVWGSPIERARRDRIKRFRDSLFNHRLLNAFDMSRSQMDTYVQEILRYRPACLFGYPSSVALLANHAVETGHDLTRANLRAVFVTGEVCYPHQRRAISDAFGVTVADGYGSREAGFIAHQCPEGQMHITAENVIVEIVGSNAETLPIGDEGEIVVTHLDAYAMPFIRYRTGDVGSLKTGRCACGRGLPIMNVVRGRTTDFLYRPDGTIMHALSIIYPLRELPGIEQFHVTQNEDFSIQIDVVVDDRIARITQESVARRVRPVLGEQIPFCISLVDHIAQSISGKHRYVESHVKRKTAHLATEGNSRD